VSVKKGRRKKNEKPSATSHPSNHRPLLVLCVSVSCLLSPVSCVLCPQVGEVAQIHWCQSQVGIFWQIEFLKNHTSNLF
jgi:hypothetical protein